MHVLNGKKNHGFTEEVGCAKVTQIGSCASWPMGPNTICRTLEELDSHDLHGFSGWVMDAFSLVDQFVSKVVHGRKATRLEARSSWTREGLASHPHEGFVPPLPLLHLTWFVILRILAKNLGFWFSHHLLMHTFGKPRCLIFAVMVSP